MEAHEIYLRYYTRYALFMLLPRTYIAVLQLSDPQSVTVPTLFAQESVKDAT